MGTAILTIVGIGTIVAGVMFVMDALESRARSRERATMRRLVDYMNLIPRRERRPW